MWRNFLKYVMYWKDDKPKALFSIQIRETADTICESPCCGEIVHVPNPSRWERFRKHKVHRYCPKCGRRFSCVHTL